MNEIEELRSRMIEEIIHQGVAILWNDGQGSVNHQNLPWAYTSGRTMDGEPELLVTGLSEALSLNLLTELSHVRCHPDFPMMTKSAGRVAFIQAETGLLHAAWVVFGTDYSALQVIHTGSEQPVHSLGTTVLTDPYPEE